MMKSIGAGLLLLPALALAGCASAPTRFFTLDATPASNGAGVAYAGPPVRVVAVHIPPALDRVELVREVGPGEVKVDDFSHWEAPLGLTARQVLTQDLAARLPSGRVVTPDAGGVGAAVISVDILSFQSAAGGAVMQVGWSATLPPTTPAQPPLTLHRALVTLQGPPAEAGGAGTAQAMSGLLGQLADRIATDLAQPAAG